MSVAVCRSPISPRPLLSLLQTPEQSNPKPAKVKFDAAFIERRMKEHKRWQERETRRLCEEIREEMGFRVPYRLSSTRPLPFEGNE
jgi:hypothetical protein